VSFGSIAEELQGIIPKLPWPYAKTLTQRALKDVYRGNLWSFLLFEGNWTSPPIITTGTVTTVQGQNTVVFNAAASAAILASNLLFFPIISYQFRLGAGTIYNVWGFANNAGTITLTLDRPYQEVGASGSGYMLFKCYYAAPVQDWKSWITVRDMVNYNDLIIDKTRAYVDERDPQRILYYIPTHVVPYSTDLNPASPTYQFQLFELWGQPQFELTYQLWGVRKGKGFVNLTDTVPPQIGDDVVSQIAQAHAYSWAGANKKASGMTMSEARAGSAAAMAEYKRLMIDYRREDRQLVNNFGSRIRRGWSWPSLQGWYSSDSGYASPGAPW
jgi:hypothetical protein